MNNRELEILVGRIDGDSAIAYNRYKKVMQNIVRMLAGQ
jgi:hypothetical protein